MLLLPRFELMLMIFLYKAAMIGTRAFLASGPEQRTCCPSLGQKISRDTRAKRQLPRFAYLESGRVHLETMESQTKSFAFDHSCLTHSYCQMELP